MSDELSTVAGVTARIEKQAADFKEAKRILFDENRRRLKNLRNRLAILQDDEKEAAADER